MKQIKFYVLLLTFIFPFKSFCQSANSTTDIPDIKDKPIFIENTLLIGFRAGAGISKQTTGYFNEGNLIPKFSYHFAVELTYFFHKNIGIQIDLGNQYFKTRNEDQNSTNFNDFSIQYLFVAINPVFNFKHFCFNFGVYFAIPVKANYEGNLGISNDLEYYTIPDFGYQIGILYLFDISSKGAVTKKYVLFIGVEIKGQFSEFLVSKMSGKTFAVYFDVGIKFSI